MTDRDAHHALLTPRAARDMLVSLVEQAASAADREPDTAPRGLRVETPIVPMDPLAWLQAQPQEEKVYWADRDGAARVAGVGAADVVWAGHGDHSAAVDGLSASLSCAHPDLRYYGGLAFDARRATAPEWGRFGACRFVLPRFELVDRAGRSFLACNLLLHGATPRTAVDGVLDEIGRLVFSDGDSGPAVVRAVSRRDRPEFGDWEFAVRRVLGLIRTGELSKVVLARESVFRLDHAPEPAALLRRLAQSLPRAYHFCFQPERGTAFIGATPERLYLRHGRHIESEALAGTRPRGKSPDEDRAFGEELLSDDKERREHQFVVEFVRGALERLCRQVHVEGDVALMQLPHCQHLFCELEGILVEPHTDASLLHALHPTPAVGGHPTTDALRAIADTEPFARGWYAGPVGWIGPDAAEFAVAIRSGLVRDDTLSLYSGAGIVEGSTSEREWDEIETKMGGFLSVLTGNDA